ncbi:LacI family transcriptional regulator [Sphingomonas turrisvirgatae]|uniref:LacI family transcriptional regulator n=2 Tax=Sphingomonas turrisvirgatae TaxID=1888892 RepID=A0A1E3LY90_9SPHN|nr:LacI family transcriptional regulator [Sphingomonas turrisvirgatae]
MGAPTIADVARLAGVSAMTVSRVINAEANVRESKREAVQAAIAALNYAPNRAARTLAGIAPLRIGLLYSNPSAGFLSEFLLGSLAGDGSADLHIAVEKCEADEAEVDVAQRLIAAGVDGVVLPPPLCESDTLLAFLAQNGIPAVAVASGRQPATAMSVRIDDRAAAMTMMRHLLALGHRRIGFVTGDPALSASALRLDGYRAALDEAGLAADETLVASGLFTYRSGLAAAERLLELDDRPTAIFCSNDDMAAAAVAVAHRYRIDVPGDLTVCGFDDTSLATAIWPELTTIRQPIADMAQRAVEMLVHSLRRGRSGDAGQPHRRLDYALIRRQSDAVPRRRPTQD